MIKSNFQTIVLVIFGVGALIGVAAFSVYQATSSGSNIPELHMWGTLPAEYFSHLGGDKTQNDHLNKIKYREISSDRFDQELIEAMADGRGPDIVILKDDSFLRHRNRIYKIPFETYSASDYSNAFISSSSVFQDESGSYALPAIVDPLVMYWNRDILSSAGMAAPPEYWDEMRGLSERLTKTDGFLNIERSAVSLGTFENINNAKDLVSLLLMQSGSRIVSRSGGRYVADFSQSSTNMSLPPSEALNFYTEFASPNKQAYSWNNSMPMSRDVFLAEDLAIYFGLASEERELIRANPNLNLGVSFIPQVRASDRRMTTGDMYGFAAIKNSKNFNHAFTAIFHLAGAEGVGYLDKATGLPSVRNSLLKEDPSRASSRIGVNSALVLRLWPDPERRETHAAFSRMISSVLSNEMSASDAVGRLQREISNLLPN